MPATPLPTTPIKTNRSRTMTFECTGSISAFAQDLPSERFTAPATFRDFAWNSHAGSIDMHGLGVGFWADAIAEFVNPDFGNYSVHVFGRMQITIGTSLGGLNTTITTPITIDPATTGGQATATYAVTCKVTMEVEEYVAIQPPPSFPGVPPWTRPTKGGEGPFVSWWKFFERIKANSNVIVECQIGSTTFSRTIAIGANPPFITSLITPIQPGVTTTGYIGYRTLLGAFASCRRSTNTSSVSGTIGGIPIKKTNTRTFSGQTPVLTTLVPAPTSPTGFRPIKCIAPLPFSVTTSTDNGASVTVTGSTSVMYQSEGHQPALSPDDVSYGSRSNTEGLAATASLDVGSIQKLQIQGDFRMWDKPFDKPIKMIWFPYFLGTGRELTGVSVADSIVAEHLVSKVVSGYSQPDPYYNWPIASYNTITVGNVDKAIDSPAWGLIDTDSLASVGESGLDCAIYFGGPTWDVFTVNHAGSTNVDNANGAGWVSVANTTVTKPGTSVVITVTGSNPSAKRVFATPFNAEGYAKLRIRCRSKNGAGEPVTFTIGGKSWRITTGATDTYDSFDLDLMCPDITSIVAELENRYPIDTKANNIPKNEGRHFGVNVIRELIVEGLRTGAIIEIDDVTLVRTDYATFDITSAFDAFVEYCVVNPNPPVVDYVKRICVGNVDGRQSADSFDIGKETTVAGTTQWWQTIAELIGDINKIPGWSAVDSGAGNFLGITSILTNAREAAHVGGGGRIVTVGGAVDQFGRDAAAGFTQKAQYLIDMVSTYPGCGDPFAGSGYNTDAPLVLRFTKLFRGRAHGTVHNSQDKRVPNVAIRLVADADGRDGGQAITDGLGYFVTGEPFAFGDKPYKVYADPGSVLLGPINPIKTRRKTRIGGIFNFPGKGAVAILANPNTGMYHMPFTTTDGISINVFDTEKNTDITHPILSSTPGIDAVDIAWHPRRMSHVVTYEKDGAVYQTESAANSDVGTWTTPVMVSPAAKNHVFDIHPVTGTEYIAGYDGHDLVCLRKKPDETAFTKVGTIMPGTNLRGAIRWGVDSYRALQFAAIDATDGTPIRKVSTNDGETWNTL